MTNRKSLVISTLQQMGKELLAEKFRLRRIRMENGIVTEEEADSMARIKALRDKIDWELRHHGSQLS